MVAAWALHLGRRFPRLEQRRGAHSAQTGIEVIAHLPVTADT
ncbi:hypothetical protein AB0K00_53240 [Dactylosporangium sp. NPDC049525]